MMIRVYLKVNDRETFIRYLKKKRYVSIKSQCDENGGVHYHYSWHLCDTFDVLYIYFSIHGHIVIPAVAVAIIDTPQFQRLRFLKQV